MDRLNEQKQQKKADYAKKEKQQELNQKAFDEWYEQAKNRPRTAPHSFGYTQGKLTGE